jgi:CBS domain-containing protein
VQEAAAMMGELDVGALPVGAPERLEGVLTDRDILYRVVARGLDCAAVRVRDVLTTPVLSCRAEDDVRDAMDLMAAHHIRRLPVRDAAGRVVGWVTLADLSRRPAAGQRLPPSRVARGDGGRGGGRTGYCQ